MTWSEVLKEKSLRDLPYKIELNEWGQIVMTSKSNLQGRMQASISVLSRESNPRGKVLVGCSVDTARGVKVADVAWLSDRFFRRYKFETPYPEAPEICVEVVLP